MKNIKRLISLVLAIAVLASMPLTAFASTITSSPFTTFSYTHQSKHDGDEIMNGLDLSEHNGTVDFKKIKSAGVEFVILRVGARGYGAAGKFVNDIKFSTYYNDAKNAGLPVGVYFYSQAITEAEAVEEADKVLTILKGKKLELPVVFDYEFASVNGSQTGRLIDAWNDGRLNKDKMTKNAIAFCERVKSKGYKPMVYASKYFFYDNLNYSQLEEKGYQIWLAHYTNKTDYKGNYDVWQYSEKGTVNGIDGKVDCNFMYVSQLVLDKPKASLVSSTDNSAFIEWDEVKNADGYEVVRKVNGEFTHICNVEGGFGVKITGLNTATNYYLYVRAYVYVNGVKQYGEVGNLVKITTEPVKVTGLKFVSRTDTAITISWDKVGNASSYKVYFDNGTGKYALLKSVTTNTVTINTLKPYTLYRFKVKACKGDLIGPTSNAYAVYTKPKTPTVKEVTSPSSKKIKITWDKNTKVAGYQVQWSTTKDFSSNKKSVTIASSTAISKTISTAQSNQYYSIRVRSYVIKNGSKFYSDWSKPYRLKVK